MVIFLIQIGVRSFQAFIAALVSKRKKVPLVISDQGGLTTHPDLKKSSLIKRILIEMQKPLIKFVINNASKIIVANEYEKKIFLNFCNESKISIVKNSFQLHSTINYEKKMVIRDFIFTFIKK